MSKGRRVGVTPGYIFAHVEDRQDLSIYLECINKAGRMNFAGIGLEILCETHEAIFSDANLLKISELLERYDLRVEQFIAEYAAADLFSLDPKRRARGRDRIGFVAELCLKLGRVEVVHIPSYKPEEWLETGAERYPGLPGAASLPPERTYGEFWDAGLESFRDCLADLKDTPLSLAIEPRPDTLLTTADGALRFADQLETGTNGLKVVLDTSHLQAQREMIDVAIEKASSRLVGIHLSDHSAANYREPLGRGMVNWDAVFASLRKIEYRGPLDIELYGGNIEDVDAEYWAGKAFVESRL